MNIVDIRALANLKRAEFARKYNIPIRTVEDWENGKGNAPVYVKALLERAVREDFGLPSVYRVYMIGNGNQWIVLETANIDEARMSASNEAYAISMEGLEYSIEIRLGHKSIQEDDTYELIDFE